MNPVAENLKSGSSGSLSVAKVFPILKDPAAFHETFKVFPHDGPLTENKKIL